MSQIWRMCVRWSTVHLSYYFDGLCSTNTCPTCQFTYRHVYVSYWPVLRRVMNVANATAEWKPFQSNFGQCRDLA